MEKRSVIYEEMGKLKVYVLLLLLLLLSDFTDSVDGLVADTSLSVIPRSNSLHNASTPRNNRDLPLDTARERV